MSITTFAPGAKHHCRCSLAISIVSDQPGTTTDPVEKTFELAPLGPVVFIDTAGFDDEGALGELRVQRTRQVLERVDIGLVVVGSEGLGAFEQELIATLRNAGTPLVVAFNKAVREIVPLEKLDIYFEVANTINEIIDKRSIYEKVNLNQLKVNN